MTTTTITNEQRTEAYIKGYGDAYNGRPNRADDQPEGDLAFNYRCGYTSGNLERRYRVDHHKPLHGVR